jgi:hypothetical protein
MLIAIRTPAPSVGRVDHHQDASQARLFQFLGLCCGRAHVEIDVKGVDMDAIFISTHKFVGGPGHQRYNALKGAD